MLPHLVGFASNGFDFEHEFCQSTFRQVPEPGQSTSYVARHSSALVVLDLALSGQVKTGHMWSLQNRPWEGSRDLDVVLCRSLFGQV